MLYWAYFTSERKDTMPLIALLLDVGLTHHALYLQRQALWVVQLQHLEPCVYGAVRCDCLFVYHQCDYAVRLYFECHRRE